MPRGVFQLKKISWRALDVKSIEAEVYKELDREGDILIRQYELTTRSWNHKPIFWKAVGRSMYKAGVRVYTDDPIFAYVDYGTRPHVIRPRRARVLSFLSGYKAKTSPRVIGSHSGGASGKRVFAREVHHPGTKAREFTAEILKRRAASFAKNIQAAIERGFLRGLKG